MPNRQRLASSPLPAEFQLPPVEAQGPGQPRPTRGYIPAPWATPPPMLAANARTARSHLGNCQLCRQPMRPGQRVADLADATGTAHIWCAARQPHADETAWTWTG